MVDRDEVTCGASWMLNPIILGMPKATKVPPWDSGGSSGGTSDGGRGEGR